MRNRRIQSSDWVKRWPGALLALLLLAASGAVQALPAFPGAEGHGAQSIGGRGGRVVPVTTLADSGPGSLREALEATGPRIVIFRVAGTIALESVIKIEDGRVTVAGQTAPGGGILLRGVADDPLIRIEDGAHDVVIQYLRMRNGSGPANGSGNDNLTIRSGHDIIVDHVSMSWASDENAGLHRNTLSQPPLERVTIQRSVFAEGLSGHSNGMIVGGLDDRSDPSRPVEAWRDVREISIHHNLFAHNTHRNPRVTSGATEAINNVTYNWRTRIGSTTRGSVFDYINNYSKVGPMRIGDLDYVPKILMHHEHRHVEGDVWPDPSIHTAGNVIEPGIFTDPNADNRTIWSLNYSDPKHQPLPSHYWRTTRLPAAPIPVTIETAREAFSSVMVDVGANRRLDCEGNWVSIQDAVDRRILDDVANGTGPDYPYASAQEAGGYPALESGEACPDGDGDGMPDDYEAARGLDPADPADGAQDSNGDGYDELESFLHGPAPSLLNRPILLPS